MKKSYSAKQLIPDGYNSSEFNSTLDVQDGTTLRVGILSSPHI
jgi:hypothetical protein